MPRKHPQVLGADLNRFVQLAVAGVVHGEHEQAIQDRQLIVRVHAADELIAQAVACAF
jgi:hypothetical protein